MFRVARFELRVVRFECMLYMITRISQFFENGRNRIEAFEKKNITRQFEDVFQGMGVTGQ